MRTYSRVYHLISPLKWKEVVQLAVCCDLPLLGLVFDSLYCGLICSGKPTMNHTGLYMPQIGRCHL